MKVISSNKVQFFVAFSVFSQSLLVICQHLLIQIAHIPDETATTYRVVFTAIPILVSIYYCFRNNPTPFFITYSCILGLFLAHSLLFPSNYQYIWTEGTRYLLPVCLPSFVCLLYCKIDIIEKAVYWVSWLVFIASLIFFAYLLMGRIFMSSYNMAIGYALLLPMIALFAKKTKIPMVASLVMFLICLSIGSRGSAFSFALFVVFDTLILKKKNIFIISFLIIFFIVSLPSIIDRLDTFGMSSRTVEMVLSDDALSDSGRSTLYNLTFEALMQNPVLGLGLWGDRVILEGAYCHNFLLEVCTNFGLLFGSILILFLGGATAKAFLKSNAEEKNVLLKYFFGLLVPLFVSGSYLISYNFASFCGILLVIMRNSRMHLDSQKPVAK